jgi:hypothetical protein
MRNFPFLKTTEILGLSVTEINVTLTNTDSVACNGCHHTKPCGTQVIQEKGQGDWKDEGPHHTVENHLLVTTRGQARCLLRLQL